MVTASERIDTVIGKIDTILVKNIGQTDNCVALHDVSTNGYDVMIVFSICVTCVILGLILLAYFILKRKDINSLKKHIDDKDREIKELEDRLAKIKETSNSAPSSEITATLKKRKLDFLEDCTKDVESARINSEASKKFLSYIDELIKENNKEDSEKTSDK
ncbi:MAG: hypothetical protein IKK81_04145 [Prevotella sp.]|nr:hypothetical protein [Prevotella sp.]